MYVEDLEVQFKLPSHFLKKRLIEMYSPGYLFHTLAFFIALNFQHSITHQISSGESSSTTESSTMKRFNSLSKKSLAIIVALVSGPVSLTTPSPGDDMPNRLAKASVTTLTRFPPM